MPLVAPNLDTRTFEDLLAEARLRIARYNPGWTDFNDSDPGMTLVHLFAWLTELMLVQFNQVPELNYIKFLQLMGFERRAAQPATAHLTFQASPGVESDPLDRFTAVTAQPPGGGDTLIFETDAGLDLVRAKLSDLQVFDGATFKAVTSNNAPGVGGFAPFGLEASRGSALYMGFSPPDPPTSSRIFPQEMRLRVFLSAEAQVGRFEDANAANVAAISPVTLVWEYHPANEPGKWNPLNMYEDGSLGFTREGYILLQGPPDIAATVEGRITEKRYWLRARLASGSYPTGRKPQLDFVRFNTVPAINLSTVREEDTGRSNGLSKQIFQLYRRPVDPRSICVSVEVKGQPPEIWEQVDDFLHSGREDSRYTFNGNTARVFFGDGEQGRIPPAGAVIVAKRYRFGGGASGNVAAGVINGLPGNVKGLESVTNERAAEGGRDEQSVDDLKATAPRQLRSGNRAVTVDDFTQLAKQAGGVAKATAIGSMHPEFRGATVPGAVTVVIVPDNDDLAPKPTADHLVAVSRYLNGFRLLTTELFVKGPQYNNVEVDALVAAQPYTSFAKVARDVDAALKYYLDPLARLPVSGKLSDDTLRAAGTEQWEFGEALHPTSLFSVILGVDGVAYVKNLRITVDGTTREIAAPVELPVDGLLSSGNHQVTVVPA